jgi:cytochrome c556
MTRCTGRDAQLRLVASRFGCWAALIAACLTAPMFAAVGQAQSIPPPKDAIFARKILMGAIDMNMDEIETMLAPEGRLDLAEGREHANTISIMLMAFPHMFAASTNQWTASANRDPATDTFASPDVWTDMSDFYQRATEASKFALDAVRAKRPDAFRPAIAQLRAACNACHAVYMKAD